MKINFIKNSSQFQLLSQIYNEIKKNELTAILCGKQIQNKIEKLLNESNNNKIKTINDLMSSSINQPESTLEAIRILIESKILNISQEQFKIIQNSFLLIKNPSKTKIAKTIKKLENSFQIKLDIENLPNINIDISQELNKKQNFHFIQEFTEINQDLIQNSNKIILVDPKPNEVVRLTQDLLDKTIIFSKDESFLKILFAISKESINVNYEN